MKHTASKLEERVMELESITNTLVSVVLMRQQLTKEQQEEIGSFLSSPMLSEQYMTDEGVSSTSKNRKLFNKMTSDKTSVMGSVVKVNQIEKLNTSVKDLQKQVKNKSRLSKWLMISIPIIIVAMLGIGFSVTQNLYKKNGGESLRSVYISKQIQKVK